MIGTATYAVLGSCKHLLTCGHVARSVPVHYRFNGTDNVFKLRNKFRTDAHPHDVALAIIDENQWRATEHHAEALRYDRFGVKHNPSTPEEVLFFYGWAGENARYGFEVHETIGTGYCSQEIKGFGDQDYFKMFWDPQKTIIDKKADLGHNRQIKVDDPGRFSGSVFWNIRYCEVTRKKKQWSPADAVVTGLLQRWGQKKKSLMVRRIERLREWIDDSMEI